MSIYFEPIVWRSKGTKGRHSSVPPSHIMPVRRHAPVMAVPRHQTYSSPRHDYGIDESLQKAGFLSHAVLEDTYDQAARSRGKDQDLLRNVNSALRPSRDSTPSHRHRYHTIATPTKRFHSLPPSDHHSYSSRSSSKISVPPSTGIIVPYRRPVKKSRASYMEDLPSPTSLLSSKISGFLKGSSVPPRPLPSSVASNISYKSRLSHHAPHDTTISHVTNTNLLADPAVTRLLSRPSPSSQLSDYDSESLLTKFRALPSPYVSRARSGLDYTGGDDEEEVEDEDYTPYRRKYRFVRGPAISYGDDATGDYEDDDAYESYGTYTCPCPSNTSLLKLSSYDGEYDGSYDADMAEMYDYVPFGPSNHGLFELTHHETRDADSYIDSETPLSIPLQSTATTYLPPPPSVPPLSSSVLPVTSVTLPSPVIDSLVSSTAAQARRIMHDSSSTLPDYKDASLVLSLEGSAVSEDGKSRYGFRYYPPPIPLKGSDATLGLDERILGIVPPRSGASAADSFLTGYLERLRNIRVEARDHVDRGEYARGRSVPPSTTHTSISPTRYSPVASSTHHYHQRYSSPYPSSSPPSVSLATLSPYTHSTIHVPVHLSGRATSVPVSSYRSRAGEGVTHRVDVYPLVESEARLPGGRHLHLPLASGGGAGIAHDKLTMLEKINIKVSTEVHEKPKSAVISRRVRASTAPPAPRPPPGYQAHAQMIKVPAVHRPGPVLVAPATRPASVVYLPPPPDTTSYPPAAPYFYVYVPPSDLAPRSDSHYHSSSFANPNQPASKPVVLRQGTPDKQPWYLERAARARSVALESPAPPRAARGASMPPGPAQHQRKAPPLTLPPAPLPTSGMRASRRMPPAYEAAVLRARARSLDRGGSLGAAPAKPGGSDAPASQQLWAHRPVMLRKNAALVARARTDPRNPYSASLRRAASEPRLVERSANSQHSYFYPNVPASTKFYHRVPGASEKAMQRHLYSHRGRYGPDAKPPRPSLASFPQVYVPWTGPGPSNRAKAAIIGSKMEPESRAAKKGPRSQFAQNKMREMRMEDIQESVFARTPSSSALHASKPPLPKPTNRKAIRDVDGFTKPKNIMSWEWRYGRLLSYSPEPRHSYRAASVPPRYARASSVAPASPAIYYREVSLPPARRASLYSRESSVVSQRSMTPRATSVPPVVPALPTPRSYLLSGGYTAFPRLYLRSAYRPVTSSRAVPARLVVLPNRPVFRPLARRRKHYRKIKVVQHPSKDVVVDTLPPVPHLKQWSASPRILARPRTPSTRSEGGNPSTVNIPAYYAAGGDPDNRPMSDLRRRLRRTLAKSKNNPEYYKE